MGYSDESWWEKGACRTANPQIFDGQPDKGGRPTKDGKRSYAKQRQDWSAAKKVCASCLVQPECLDYMLSLPFDGLSDQSFAAGFTPDQLGEIRAKRRQR